MKIANKFVILVVTLVKIVKFHHKIAPHVFQMNLNLFLTLPAFVNHNTTRMVMNVFVKNVFIYVNLVK
jgi:hypothetical protein